MPKKNQTLPDDVINHWPEIFGDVDVQVVPLQYLDSIRVFFIDGKIWDIDIEKSRKNSEELNLEEILEQMFQEYDQVIENVDFRLNTSKLKKDIQRRTRIFLKKNK